MDPDSRPPTRNETLVVGSIMALCSAAGAGLGFSIGEYREGFLWLVLAVWGVLIVDREMKGR